MKTSSLLPCLLPKIRLLLAATASLAALGLGGFSASAQTVWTGSAATDDWNTAGNWFNATLASSFVPNAGTTGDSTGITDSGATVTVPTGGAAHDIRVLIVSGATSGTSVAPTLNVMGDLHVDSPVMYIGGVDQTVSGAVAASNRGGNVVHTSGTLLIDGSGAGDLNIGGRFGVGVTDQSGSYIFGGAQLTAPVLTIGRAVRIAEGESGANNTGLFHLKDYGTVTIAENLTMGTNNASSNMTVDGGNLSITVSGNLMINPSNGGDANLNVELDADGVSTINVVGDVTIGNNASPTLGSFFNLTLDAGFSAALGQKFTILSLGGVFLGGGVFDNVADASTISAGGYDFLADYTSDPSDNTFTLEVTAVPEPGTLALLLPALGLALLRTRRLRGKN